MSRRFFLFVSVVRWIIGIRSVVRLLARNHPVQEEVVGCESRCGACVTGKRIGMAAGRDRKTTLFRHPLSAVGRMPRCGRSGQVERHLFRNAAGLASHFAKRFHVDGTHLYIAGYCQMLGGCLVPSGRKRGRRIDETDWKS